MKAFLPLKYKLQNFYCYNNIQTDIRKRNLNNFFKYPIYLFTSEICIHALNLHLGYLIKELQELRSWKIKKKTNTLISIQFHTLITFKIILKD